MELTNTEKKLLSGISFNADAIEQGELDEKDMAMLLEIRAVDAYLHKKYPSYSFELTGCEPMEGTIKEYNEWYYTGCKASEASYQPDAVTLSAHLARAKKENDKYLISDDFYGEVIKDEIKAELEKSACACGFPVVQTNIGFWEFFDEKYGEGISYMDVLTGKIKAGNDIKIFLDGSGLKQDSYQNAVADLKKCMQQKAIKGDVYVVFLKTADGDPAKDRVYSESFTLE